MGTAPGAGELSISRVNADNILDVAVVSRASNRVGVALGVGDGNFLAPTSITVTNPDGVAVADFDLDGKFDLVVGGITRRPVLLT